MTGSPVQNNPVDSSEKAFQHAMYVNSTLTETVTGACETVVPPPLAAKVAGAPLQPLAAGQCLLLTDIGGILILGSGSTWIDNLYVRAVYTGRTPAFAQSLMTTGDFSVKSSTSTVSTSTTSGGNMPYVYVTGVQLQGDNVFERSGEVQSVLGLGVAAPTYMSGSSILHTGGHQEAIWVHSASVNIINSTVTDNTMSRGVDFASIVVTEGGLRLQGTRLARNSAPVLLRTAEDETGTIVSDAPLEYLTTVADGDFARSDPLYTPAAQSPPPGLPFLDGSEAWFVSTTGAEEFAGRPVAATAYPPASPSALTRVATAAKLQEAMQNGARHIVVEAHLDLSSLELVDSTNEAGTPNYLLGIVRDTTQSIMGNCTGAGDPAFTITGVPLVPRKPGQCVLLADADLLTLGPGRLWVHNLYIRHKASQRDSGVSLMYSAPAMGGRLWMTGCTLQGTGTYDSTFGADGAWMHSQAYVEGCDFLNLGGTLPAIMAKSTEVRVVNSTVSDTFVPNVDEGVIVADTGATVWLQGTSVSSNKAVLPLIAKTEYTDGDGAIFSDRADPWFFWDSNSEQEQRETGQVPSDTSAFLSFDDEWFASVRKEVGSASGVAVPASLSTAAAVPAVAPVRVTTAQELVSAVSKGVRHIRVMDHIDLTERELPWPDVDAHLGHPSSTTHTITGNCSGEIPAAMLDAAGAAARRPGQCAIIVDTDLLALIHGRLWMDSLFVTLRRTSRTSTVNLIVSGDEERTTYTTPAAGSLWLTRSVVQGDVGTDSEDQSVTGLAVFSTFAANDVQVRQCGGEYIPVYVFGTASFEACSFVGNILTDENTGGISYTKEAGSITWLKNVTFVDNTGTDIVAEGEGRVFSSEPGLEYYTLTSISLTLSKQATPVPVQTARTAQFLSFSDPWLLEAATEAGYTINTIQETSAPAGPAAASADSPSAAPQPSDTSTVSNAGVPAPPSSGSSPLINTDTISIEADGLVQQVVLPPGSDSASAPPDAPPNASTTTDDADSSPDPAGGARGGVGILSATVADSGEEADAAAPGTPAAGSGRDSRTVLIVSVATLIAGVIAVVVGTVFLLRRRRRRRQGGSTAPAQPPHASATQAGGVHGAAQSVVGQKPGYPWPGGMAPSTAPGHAPMPPPPMPPQPMPLHTGAHQHPYMHGGSAHGHAQPTYMYGAVAQAAAAGHNYAYGPPQHQMQPQPSASDTSSQASGVPPMQPGTAAITELTATVYSRPTQSTITASTAKTGAPATDLPANGAAAGVGMAPAKDQLQAELTAMYENKERFLDKYRVLEPEERRVGGQGLVQFMSWKHGAEPVAVKFFLARGAFEAELQLYSEGGLRSMMPEKVTEVPAGAAQSVRGYAFPPCIVLKKGQSLQDWRDIVRPELETVFDALSHIAQKLEQLHASGWVHRDLKPGNILRLPHLHSWTLMDFGSAGQTGQQLPGSHAVTTLIYCPPEAVLARKEGVAAFEVSEAADMWALGLISFELLTRKKPFLFMSAADVEERLCGQTPLLWEEEGDHVQQVLKPLGVLRGTVLACLNRDPSQRPSAADVRRAWKRIIANNTTAS